MKKTILIVSILVVLSALTVGIVLAQSDGPDRPYFPGYFGPHGGMMGGGYHGHGEGYMHEYMHTAFADALGISEEEFEARMEAGESMYDIALSLGFDEDEIAEIHDQAMQAAFDLAESDGFIDEEHYEWMLERMNGFDGFSMHDTDGFGMHGGGFTQGGGCHGYYQEAPSE